MPPTKKHKIDTELLEPLQVRIPQPQRIAVSPHGVVATAHFCASEAGAEIMQKGGNAIDAAVASAFALGVCEPQASGLGGQTMMLIHLARKNEVIAVDGSSRVPNRGLRDDFRTAEPRLHGCRATTVPATPATLAYVLERYGSMSLADVLVPATRIADEGYPITELQAKLQRRELRNFAKGNAGTLFLREGLRPFPVGHTFRQPVLAKTLRRLAKSGIEDFYLGDIAHKIHGFMESQGGLLRKDDLAQIPYPIERETVTGRYGNLTVHTMPPPGAGRTLIEMLNILRRFPREDRNPDTPEGALLLAEVIRRAQLDRRDRPFHPNYYPQVQDRRMLSNEYAKLAAEQVRARLESHGETTHLSVADHKGNVVALTQSIERVYGAKIVVPQLGFLFNNYMSAYEYKDMSHPYYLRPNGVPWASVAPTIIYKAKKPWLAIGSPGSERIAGTIVQVLVRLNGQSPFDAVSAPRIHCSFDGKVSMEAAYMRDDIPELLKGRGFRIDIREPNSFYLGCVQMVLMEKGLVIGVADPRRDGSAVGVKK